MGVERKRRCIGVLARSSLMYELINRVRGHVRRLESVIIGYLCPRGALPVKSTPIEDNLKKVISL